MLSDLFDPPKVTIPKPGYVHILEDEPKLSRKEWEAKWREKNREKIRAYQSAWQRKRRSENRNPR